MEKEGMFSFLLYFLFISARGEELMKVVEVYLDHVTWRLIQPDGQLQIVDANLTNLR